MCLFAKFPVLTIVALVRRSPQSKTQPRTESSSCPRRARSPQISARGRTPPASRVLGRYPGVVDHGAGVGGEARHPGEVAIELHDLLDGGGLEKKGLNALLDAEDDSPVEFDGDESDEEEAPPPVQPTKRRKLPEGWTSTVSGCSPRRSFAADAPCSRPPAR